jgi:hypothetical protein
VPASEITIPVAKFKTAKVFVFKNCIYYRLKINKRLDKFKYYEGFHCMFITYITGVKNMEPKETGSLQAEARLKEVQAN